MRIERTELVDALTEFSIKGNGLVIGPPGVGKSHTLLELRRRFQNDARPHLLLPIDKLGEGSDEELHSLLGSNDDPISWLNDLGKQMPSVGVLLFDAFDAARNESTQNRFLHLIGRALTELTPKWNVVVTVRTYDARKSGRLQELFGRRTSVNPSEYALNDITCRHFHIPPLNDAEIAQAANQVPLIAAVLPHATDEFKVLMRSPFNLWLLEKLSEDITNPDELTTIRSEAQLLSLFWDRRVTKQPDSEAREHILGRLVQAMVAQKNLSAATTGLYEISADRIWQRLRSDELIVSVGTGGRRTAFSHNMLFDYAASILALDDNPNEFIKYISEEQQRPLFLLPSLSYYFTRLWYENKPAFWGAFEAIAHAQELSTQVLAQTLPFAIIVNEASSSTDLGYFIQDGTPEKSKYIRLVLNALMTLGVKRRKVWVAWLKELADRLDWEFAWQAEVILNTIIDEAVKTEDHDLSAQCGIVARMFFDWVWNQRDSNPNAANSLLGAWAVETVTKTYSTDIRESSSLLDRVLNLTKEAEFPITPLYRLTSSISEIWPHDLDFTAQIYRTIFGYHESSDAPVSWGSLVVPLVSNRRQDYEMCHYVLVQEFPKIVRFSPLAIIPAIMEISSRSIVGEHIVPHLTVEYSEFINTQLKTFRFRGSDCYFLDDLSSIWAESFHRDNFQSLTDEVFRVLAELSAENNIDSLEEVLNLIQKQAALAYHWRKLLETASAEPDSLAPLVWELLCTPEILLSSDTVRQACTFLSKGSQYLSSQERNQIESAIVGLVKTGSQKNKRRSRHFRDRLLASIPENLLVSGQAKRAVHRMKNLAEMRENKPFFSSEFTQGTYTDRDFLKDQGVAVDTDENAQIIAFFPRFDAFASTWRNKRPTEDAIHEFLDIYNEVIAFSKATDERVDERLRTKLAEGFSTVARGISDPDTDEFHTCRTMLLKYAVDPSPSPKDYAGTDEGWSGWSPSPRHASAQGLPWLAALKADREIINSIDTLLHDRVASIRFLVTADLHRLLQNSPDDFWSMANEVALTDDNSMVQGFLCHSLFYAAPKDLNRVAQILNRLWARIMNSTVNARVTESLTSIAVWYVVFHDHKWGVKYLQDILAAPRLYARELQQAIHELTNCIVAHNLAVNEIVETRAKRVIFYMRMVLRVTCDTIIAIRQNSSELSDEDQKYLKDLYDTIDHLILKLLVGSEVSGRYTNQPNLNTTVEQKSQYYMLVKPVLSDILEFAEQPNGVLTASTSHHLFELLHGVLNFDTKSVINLASRLIALGTRTGYAFDPMAQTAAVEFVESILAEHRDIMQTDDQVLNDILKLLDVLAKAGWPQAQRLIWRLDEIYR